jgi:hypothetical protein
MQIFESGSFQHFLKKFEKAMLTFGFWTCDLQRWKHLNNL